MGTVLPWPPADDALRTGEEGSGGEEVDEVTAELVMDEHADEAIEDAPMPSAFPLPPRGLVLLMLLPLLLLLLRPLGLVSPACASLLVAAPGRGVETEDNEATTAATAAAAAELVEELADEARW
jgi:hypothetical protein